MLVGSHGSGLDIRGKVEVLGESRRRSYEGHADISRVQVDRNDVESYSLWGTP